MRYMKCVLLAWMLALAVARAGDDEITETVKPYIARKVLAGAVAMVVKKDGPVNTQTFGFANVAEGKKMPEDALFWIASMTKPITGTALMMLVDEGKIKLDDPVEKYLPEFKDMKFKAKSADGKEELKTAPPITIRQIMCHISGLPFKSPAEAPTLDGLPLQEAVKSYTAHPLLQEPEGKYVYSNEGINTGGRIIEVVSGMPYEEFMNKRLFEPLGMKDTTFWPTEEQLKRLATAYKPDKEKKGMEPTNIWALREPYSDRAKRFPMPGGGLFSTAHDMAKFCQMILNDGTLHGKKFLSPEAIAEMSKRSTPEKMKEAYGIGWAVQAESYGHGGAYATDFKIFPKRGMALIWLVQHNGFHEGGNKAHGDFESAAKEKYKN